MEDLASALQLTKKAADQVRASHAKKDDKFDHISEEEIKKVEQTIQEKWNWLEEKRVQLNQTPRTQQPPVYVNQIRSERQVGFDYIFKLFLLVGILTTNEVFTKEY